LSSAIKKELSFPWKEVRAPVSDGRTIQSLDRALALLETLAAAGGERSAGELAEAVGINGATAYNLLQTLKSRGYIMQSPASKYYSLGLKILQLAESVDPRISLSTTAMPYLREAASRIGETVYISVPVHGAIYRVAVAESPQALSVKATIGESRDDLAKTSSGKVLLTYMPPGAVLSYLNEQKIPRSFLEQLEIIRKRRYALNLGEESPSICGVSVPVLTESGGKPNELALILTASVPTSRFSDELVDLAVGVLNEIGQKILEKIGLCQ
jgi:IclR family acetate operon transcriptional repressor